MFQVRKIPRGNPSTNWDGALMISPREDWDQQSHRSMRGSACIDNHVWRRVVPHGKAAQKPRGLYSDRQVRARESAHAPCLSEAQARHLLPVGGTIPR